VLEQIPLFSALGPEDLRVIEAKTVRKNYRRNTIIIDHGDDASTLFLLIKGRVKIFVVGGDGKEMVFGERGPGSFVGEFALLTGGKRSASVQTLEDSEFLVLKQDAFNQVVCKHPAVALHLLRDLAKRVCELSDEMSGVALLDVYGRIRKLVQKNVRDDKGRKITGRLTHQDIADRVGSSREMVSKILKELKAGGYIEIADKRIVLLRSLPERW
jgi:CRP/FNR family cyclic AMP-dependent transcriptional regulator